MDNGAEFVNKQFKEFFYINEILRQFIMPYIPQKNGATKEKKYIYIQLKVHDLY